MTQQPIVLMYHGITTPDAAFPARRELGASFYDVSLQNFRAQMRYLKDNGYGAGQIVLTFDDGEMNNFEAAFPLLRELGFRAYFFIIAKRVGRPGYMGWEELKQLRDGGMVIGSHGFSHEILTTLQDTQIEEELRASKKFLECNLNTTVDSLSIPRGFCNDKIIRIAYEAGYTRIFISERPNHLHAQCFSRVSVKQGWPLARFAKALDGKTPPGEKIFDFCKNSVKTLFGGTFYDGIRRLILRIK